MNLKIDITAEDAHQIKIEHCKVGDVVRMSDGQLCVVIDSMGVVDGDYSDCDKSLLCLNDGHELEMGEQYFKDAMDGEITEIAGKLTGITVS
jgi:hypothetical protein